MISVCVVLAALSAPPAPAAIPHPFPVVVGLALPGMGDIQDALVAAWNWVCSTVSAPLAYVVNWLLEKIPDGFTIDWSAASAYYAALNAWLPLKFAMDLLQLYSSIKLYIWMGKMFLRFISFFV